MYRYLTWTPIAALAEWLRRVPAKYMGFPRESSNLSGCEYELYNAADFFLKEFPLVFYADLGFVICSDLDRSCSFSPLKCKSSGNKFGTWYQ